MKRKLIVFDLDDTLYDQTWPFYQAYLRCFDEQLDLYELYLSSRVHNNLHYSKVLSHEWTIDQMGIYRIQQPLKDLGIEISIEQAMEFQEWYAYYQGHLSLSDTMVEILNYLQNHQIEIAILSNGLASSQNNKLNGLNIEKWFDQKHIFVSELMGVAKPEKEAYFYIQDKLGYSSTECYYVGDSYHLDIVGANNASWHPIYLNKRNHNYEYTFELIEVNNEEELFEVIKKIAGE